MWLTIQQRKAPKCTRKINWLIITTARISTGSSESHCHVVLVSLSTIIVAYRLRSFWKILRLRRNSPKPTIVMSATTPPQTPGRTGPKIMSIAADDSLLLDVELITKKLRPSSLQERTKKELFSYLQSFKFKRLQDIIILNITCTILGFQSFCTISCVAPKASWIAIGIS